MIESWMVTAVAGILGYAVAFGVMRKSIKQAEVTIKKHSEQIDNLRVKLSGVPSSKDINQQFVSKELFHQLERHIDKRFDGIESAMKQILEKLGEK